MTISSTATRIEHTGNGVVQEFAFPYKFFTENDLVVYVDQVLKMKTTDYTVDGAGDDLGGSVTFVVAPADQAAISIERIMPITQEIDYVEGDPFPAETHEDGLDRAIMIAQQLDRDIQRTLQVALSTPSSVDTELPAPESFALIGWDEDAEALINVTSADTDHPVIALVADEADAAAASAAAASASQSAAASSEASAAASASSASTSASTATMQAAVATAAAESLVEGRYTRVDGTATAGQTNITVPGGYDEGFVQVWINGHQLPDADFTDTDLGDIVVPAMDAGDEYIVLAWGILVVAGNYLLIANNLSDLTSASTARTNLGLGDAATGDIGSEVQAWDAQLDALSAFTVLDEDDLTSDSDTALTTQQAVKAYIDAQVAAASGGWVPLQIETASASSEIVLDQFSATYDRYMIHIDDMVVSDDTTDLYATISYDDGSTFESTNYFYHIRNQLIDSTLAQRTDDSAAQIIFHQGNNRNIGNASGESMNQLSIDLWRGSTTSSPSMIGTSMNRDDGGRPNWNRFGAGHDTLDALDQIKFTLNTGTITSGTFKLYGVRNPT